jgi:uncharacterized protein YecA (UPF0149 family)
MEVCHVKQTKSQTGQQLLATSSTTTTVYIPFEVTSKRRKGYPSETHVKTGLRVVHGNKELLEKLGRNDLCPCGSLQKFKNCCMKSGQYDGSKKDYYF